MKASIGNMYEAIKMNSSFNVGSSTSFTVMTYNILHKLDSCRRGKYSYCNKINLYQNHRISKVLQILLKNLPDIICFQEVEKSTLCYLTTNLKNHNIQLATDHIHNQLPSSDGCAIFYKPLMLDFINSCTIQFNKFVDSYFPHFNSGKCSNMEQALWREILGKVNSAVLASFALRAIDNGSKNIIHVVSTRLFWDPLFNDIKLLQAYILVKEIFNYRKQFSEFYQIESSMDSPIILAGDFNSVPYDRESILFENPSNSIYTNKYVDKHAADSTGHNSGVYRLLTEGSVDVSHPDHPVKMRSNISSVCVPNLIVNPFRSAYKKVLGKEPLYTNFTNYFKGCIDYIFYYDNNSQLTITPIRSLNLPTLNDLTLEVALPNSFHPSDHVPLMIEFFATQRENEI